MRKTNSGEQRFGATDAVILKQRKGRRGFFVPLNAFNRRF